MLFLWGKSSINHPFHSVKAKMLTGASETYVISTQHTPLPHHLSHSHSLSDFIFYHTSLLSNCTLGTGFLAIPQTQQTWLTWSLQLLDFLPTVHLAISMAHSFFLQINWLRYRFLNKAFSYHYIKWQASIPPDTCSSLFPLPCFFLHSSYQHLMDHKFIFLFASSHLSLSTLSTLQSQNIHPRGWELVLFIAVSPEPRLVPCASKVQLIFLELID